MFKDLTIDVTHKIKGDQPIEQDKVLAFMKERLTKNASGAKIETRSDGSLAFKGILMGSQKSTGLQLQASVNSEGNTAKLHLNGKPYRGPLNWFVLITTLISFALWQYGFFWFFISLIGIIGLVQYNKMMATIPKAFIDKLVKETDSEFG